MASLDKMEANNVEDKITHFAVDVITTMTGYVPEKVKPYLELQRQYQLCQADVQKSIEDLQNFVEKIKQGLVQTDQEMEQLQSDTALQYEIIRSHTTTLTKLKEGMKEELVKLGVDEFVKDKFLHDGEYTGFLKNGRLEVYGKKYYMGDFQNHGYKFYEGEFKNDNEDGLAYILLHDGEQYYGQIENNYTSGRGTIFCSNGDIYVGECKKGCREGKGIMRYKNKDVYDGEWKQKVKNGKGIFTWANGETYKGTWTEGKCDGINGNF